MKLINDWYKQKFENQHLTLQSPFEVNEVYQVHTGGRSIYGEVFLSAEPHDSFKFNSLVVWPDKGHEDMYNKMVMHGIIDVLFTYTDTPILGVSIVLKKIGWDEIDSCAIGYYHAARKAIKKIIHPNDDNWNYD